MDAQKQPQPADENRANAPKGSLASAVRTVSGVTLLSRLGGLARDVLVSRLFGDTALGSAFSAGFTIPNLFRRLFGEGALSAAFIPEYSQAHKHDRAEADRFSTLTVVTLGIVTGLVTALAEVVLVILLWVLPADAERELSLRLIMVMLPFMPFICMTAILGGMLQVHGRFGPAASGPLVLNGFIIVVGLWHLLRGEIGSTWVAYTLGFATTLSGLTQAAWFAWLLRRGVSWRADWRDARPRARRMWTRLVPVLIGLGTLQINTLIDQVIAMWPIWVGPTMAGRPYPLDERSNVIIAAAQRLYQFPLGVFGIAVATAVFPLLARHVDDPARFGSTLRRGLRLSLFIGLPASAGLLLVNHDLVATLFWSGRPSTGGPAARAGFSAEGVARAAAVLAGFAPAIWAYSVNHVFARAFYAAGDTKTPMRVAMMTVALNLVLNLTLIWWLREAGLAWSTSLCAIVQCVTLGWLCHTRLHAGALDRPCVVAIGRTAACSAAMAGVVWIVMRSIPRPESWSGFAVRAFAGTVAGAVTYGLAALAAGAPELRWIIRRGGDEPPESA